MSKKSSYRPFKPPKQTITGMADATVIGPGVFDVSEDFAGSLHDYPHDRAGRIALPKDGRHPQPNEAMRGTDEGGSND